MAMKYLEGCLLVMLLAWQRTAAKDDEHNCLESDLPLWVTHNTLQKLPLRHDNVSCLFLNCFLNSSKEENQGTTEITSVHVQNHDSIEIIFSWQDLLFGINSQDASRVLLRSLQLSQLHTCVYSNATNDVIWTKSLEQRIIIGPEILTPGLHFLSVQVIDVNETCSIAWNLNVTVYENGCLRSPEEPLCSTKGSCVIKPLQTVSSCQCCPGYTGRFCEERDGCFEKPCKNEGFCVDIAEGLMGTMYQCLCKHGFQGQTCEEHVNLCDTGPCKNNATCHGNQTSYWCECQEGYTGASCENRIDDCRTKPCIYGICQEDGDGLYKCYCRQGYGGDMCEFEYDECDSNPCINGGACEDLVAKYRCHCGPGYRGRRCEIKVDLCRPNPCIPPATCVDSGNNYSCICNPISKDRSCTQQYDPCYPNPCQNGGSCWPSAGNFYCSCKPQFTGETCEDVIYPPQQPLPHVLEEPQQQPVDEKDRLKGAGLGNLPVDHLHNIYIAAATLAGACLIVIAVVTICHCRVHRTYQRFIRNFNRSCSELKQQTLPRQILTEPLWERF